MFDDGIQLSCICPYWNWVNWPNTNRDRSDDGVHTPSVQWWEVGEKVNFLHTNRVQSKPFIKRGPFDDRRAGIIVIVVLAWENHERYQNGCNHTATWNWELEPKLEVVSPKSLSGIENLKQNFQVEPNFQVLVNPDKQVPAAACVVATSRTVFLFIRVVFSFRLRLGTENLNLHFQVLIQVFSSKSQSVCSLWDTTLRGWLDWAVKSALPRNSFPKFAENMAGPVAPWPVQISPLWPSLC